MSKISDNASEGSYHDHANNKGQKNTKSTKHQPIDKFRHTKQAAHNRSSGISDLKIDGGKTQTFQGSPDQ